MNTANWLALLGIVVAAVAAFAIAAMNRKQTRQIELHRKDPSVPLKPPPHPATQFLRTWFWYIGGIGFPVVSLLMELRQKGPVTRGELVGVAVSTGELAFTLAMLLASIMMRFLTKELKEIFSPLTQFADKEGEKERN